jgi:transposase-like protein
MSKRKFLIPEQKIAIVREHLVDGVPVSALVDKHKIYAVQFYQWQKQLFEQGSVVFERKANGANVKRQESTKDRKMEQLEAKIKHKNDVMAKLLEEHIQLKLNLESPITRLGFS